MIVAQAIVPRIITIVRLKCLALSKWAVEALAEALRLELYNFDIKVRDPLPRMSESECKTSEILTVLGFLVK